MISKYFIVLTFLVAALLQSCVGIKNSPKYGFNEGYYKSRLKHKKLKLVYVVPGDDSIKVYTPTSLRRGGLDSNRSIKLAFPANEKPGDFEGYSIRQNTFDVDVLTILLKYRPMTQGFPNQLNTSILNGALFLGYRTDIYHLHYRKTPFDTYKRQVMHYGFSLGFFTGIGASRIDEYVTLNRVNVQYDGFVNPSGVALIIAIDKVNFGLTLGIDHLLDKNSEFWIYQGKPWLGMSVGLNLN